MTDPTSPQRASGTESARRALLLVLAFSEEEHTLSARRMAESAGIPLPSAYRYIATLKAMGLLLGDDQGGYRLSPRFVGLGRAAEAGDNLVELVTPHMRELAARTGEAVLLTRAVGESSVCVYRIESTHRLRISFEPGQHLALDKGASGRILLGAVDAAVRERVVAAVARQDPARADELRAAVEEAVAAGWATSSEEVDEGIWATAAALNDGQSVVAALSIPIPITRATTARQGEILALLRDAAAAAGDAVHSARQSQS